MATFAGRRAPNVSQYLANLNVVPSEYDQQQDAAYDMADDIDLFTDPDAFLELDKINGNDTSVDTNKGGHRSGDTGPLDFPSGDYSFDAHTFGLTEQHQALPHGIAQVPYSQAVTSATYSPASATFDSANYASPQTQASPAYQSGQPANPNFDPAEEGARLAAEEDKRRRNTAASARFRVKKKQREQQLEKSSKELTDKVKALEGKVTQLQQENKFLRNLVLEKKGEQELKEEYQRFRRESEEAEADERSTKGSKKGVVSALMAESGDQPVAVRSTSPAPAINGQAVAVPSTRLRYVDVGINLTDPIFRGIYHGKRVHDKDRQDVIQRAVDVGCIKLMVTGSDFKNSRKAVNLAEEHPGICYATIGVHPCSAKSFVSHPDGATALLRSLEDLALQSKASGHATAFGEIGLDYDRFFLSPKDAQLKYFEAQLDIAVRVQLPLFLHSRAAHGDFVGLLKKVLGERLEKIGKGGLVHSFTGTVEEMQELVALGLHIGVNGCSMKTEENLEVVREIPLERLQIETDGPWCEMRPSHASSKYTSDAPPLAKSVKKEKWQRGLMVKGRNEPATISSVAHAVANIKGVRVEEICDAAWRNSINMFGLGESPVE